ncbi:MAG TPA: hypothetical protein VM262_10130 [Acidimicrobiales bacterium]|nr:hypothetical protein [Acidimicrobiales bacterium]
MNDHRQAAVDHLSALLERDLLAVDDYRVLVERVLATTSSDELGALLAPLPTLVPVTRDAAGADDDRLVLRCDSGVIKEAPMRLAPMTEIVCVSGVMKVDLTQATLDDPDIDLDIDCDTGVLSVLLPREIAVEIAGHRSTGGVFKNALRPAAALPGTPRILVHVRNGGGVIKLRHPRRWWWRRRRS